MHSLPQPLNVGRAPLKKRFATVDGAFGWTRLRQADPSASRCFSQSAELREHAGLLLQVSAIAISGFAAVAASWGVNSWLAVATVISLGLGVLLTFMGLGKVPFVATNDDSDVLLKVIRGKRGLVRVATWVVFVGVFLAATSAMSAFGSHR